MRIETKIAIVAGTPMDTEMGAQVFSKYGDIIKHAISKTPVEQTFFQTQAHQKKSRYFDKLFEKFKQQKVNAVIIYCNSLSGAFDFTNLSEKYSIPVISPFGAYKRWAKKFSKIGILTANSQGASGIERVIVQSNPEIETLSVSNILWVNMIEEQYSPQEIIVKTGIKKILEFFSVNQVDIIIMGCTHFPMLSSNIG